MGKGKIGHTALDIVRKYHPNVESVQDAPKAATFLVTQEDCSKGKGKAPEACALARAACRTKEYDGAIISLSTAYLIKGKKAYRFKVPMAVQRELVSFDRSHRFEPGEYRLNVMSKASKLGKRWYPQAPRKNHGSAKYQAHRPRTHHTAGIRSL